MNLHEIHKDEVRYSYSLHGGDPSRNKAIFLIGTNVMEKVGFKIGDKLIVTKQDDSYFITHDVFGKTLSWHNPKIKANFARLILYEQIRKSLELPRVKKILLLKVMINPGEIIIYHDNFSNHKKKNNNNLEE